MPILNPIIDLLLAPFRHLPPEAGLAAFAVMLGIVVLLLFKATSHPGRVTRARNRALSRVMEIWLYRDDPWVSLGAVGRAMVDNLRYLASLSVPMLASLVPMVLLLAQAHDWFACRPLAPGETVMVVARLNPEADVGLLNGMTLQVSQGRVEGPPVRAAALREVAWQVVAGSQTAPGTLVLTTSAWRLTKTLTSGHGLSRLSACRVAGFWEWLLHPGEDRLPQGQPIARLEVRYAKAEYSLLGWHTGWLPAVLVLSFLSGLALKKPMRVEL